MSKRTLDDLETPAVIVDLDVLERNIDEMAGQARAAGVALRPHIKTHKTPAIAHRQLAAGAVGITCAKVGEAETMAAAGINDIFICYPIIGPQKTARLASLASRPGCRLSTIVDSAIGLAGLAAAFADAVTPLEVLIKVDTGLGRVGVAPGAATMALAAQVAATPGLRFGGVCAHEGTSYGFPNPAERSQQTQAAVARLVETAQALAAAGLPCTRVSAGSTPGAVSALGVAGITELRPGNYAFYDTMQVGLGVQPLERCALRVLVTVISHSTRQRAVIDAGSKTLTSDRGVHGSTSAANHGVIVGKRGITLRALSEEHGWLDLDPAGDDVTIGERLVVVPVHSCPVANLVDELVMVRSGAIVDRWPVTAAGRVD